MPKKSLMRASNSIKEIDLDVNVEDVSFEYSPFMTSENNQQSFLEDLIRNNRELESINLRIKVAPSVKYKNDLITYNQSLKDVHLEINTNETKLQGITTLAKSCPELKIIELQIPGSVDHDINIEGMISACNKLTNISYSGPKETIDYIRKKHNIISNMELKPRRYVWELMDVCSEMENDHQITLEFKTTDKK